MPVFAHRLFLTVWFLCAALAPAVAVQPEEVLKDPVLEQRARELSLGLRCLVCQNQSIDDSDAPLAKDLRLLVRERLVAGDSDDDVVAFVVARYGDFVLLKPPLKPSTIALWVSPFLLLLIGAWLASTMMVRRRNPSGSGKFTDLDDSAAPLSADEERQLKILLEQRRD